jgi:transposase
MTNEQLRSNMPDIQDQIKPIDLKITALLAEGKSNSQIAEMLNIGRDTVSRRINKNPTIIEALEATGINSKYLANKAKELLEAKRPLYNPKTQEFQDVPDNNARNTAFSTTCKLAGHLRDNVENTQNIQVNIVQYGDQQTDKNVEVEGSK